MSPYHRLLDEHIGDQHVIDVARAWDVPRYVLDDGLREQALVPSPKYLPKIARGMGLSVEELLDRIGAAELTA